MGRDFMTGGDFPAPEEVSGNAAAKKSLPPGFRFHPTDEELVSYYLKRKVLGKPSYDAIAEVEIYKHKPSDLEGHSKLKTRDKEWYFFSALDKKYDTGSRMSRKTKEGYWKATGKDREVRGGDQLIGMIKTLVFHKGRYPDGLRTNWVIHEYRLVEDEPEKNEAPQVQQGEYVLCKLFHKNDIGPPSGNRYAAFLEEEWEDWDEKALIHGENVKVMEDHVPIDVDNNGNNQIQQGKNQSHLIDLNELPREFEIDDDEPHKRVYVAEDLPLCVLNKEAPLPLVQYKRKRKRKINSSTGNSNNSSQTTKDYDISTTTSVETTNITSSDAITDTDTATALLQLYRCSDERNNLLLEEKEPESVATMLPEASSSSTKLINDLQKENHEIVLDRETLSKLDLMKAEMMINFLQGKINAVA